MSKLPGAAEEAAEKCSGGAHGKGGAFSPAGRRGDRPNTFNNLWLGFFRNLSSRNLIQKHDGGEFTTWHRACLPLPLSRPPAAADGVARGTYPRRPSRGCARKSLADLVS